MPKDRKTFILSNDFKVSRTANLKQHYFNDISCKGRSGDNLVSPRSKDSFAVVVKIIKYTRPDI